jgi:hypothetical protein
VGNGQWTADNGEWTADNGQWTADNGQWNADNGQWTADNGQWTADNGQRQSTGFSDVSVLRSTSFCAILLTAHQLGLLLSDYVTHICASKLASLNEALLIHVRVPSAVLPRSALC